MTLTTGQIFNRCKYKTSKMHLSIYSRNNFLWLSNRALRGKFVQWYWEGSLDRSVDWELLDDRVRACRQAPAAEVWLAENVPEEQPSRFRPIKSVACDIRHPALYTAACPARPRTQDRPRTIFRQNQTKGAISAAQPYMHRDAACSCICAAFAFWAVRCEPLQACASSRRALYPVPHPSDRTDLWCGR